MGEIFFTLRNFGSGNNESDLGCFNLALNSELGKKDMDLREKKQKTQEKKEYHALNNFFLIFDKPKHSK